MCVQLNSLLVIIDLFYLRCMLLLKIVKKNTKENLKKMFMTYSKINTLYYKCCTYKINPIRNISILHTFKPLKRR